MNPDSSGSRSPFAPCPRRPLSGFTLVELLVAIGVVGALAAVAALAVGGARDHARKAVCTNSLRQLSQVVHLYAADHGDRFPPYREDTPAGVTWYFGHAPAGGPSTEGDRDLRREEGPLYPYIGAVGTIEICPAFDYAAVLYKPKFRGASWAYGYNWNLGGTFRGPSAVRLRAECADPSRLVLFADCGQVNTFQAPASPGRPMLEEFYLIDPNQSTVHFRHRGKANAVFLDGHVEVLAPHGRVDTRLRGETVGRLDSALFQLGW